MGGWPLEWEQLGIALVTTAGNCPGLEPLQGEDRIGVWSSRCRILAPKQSRVGGGSRAEERQKIEGRLVTNQF